MRPTLSLPWLLSVPMAAFALAFLLLPIVRLVQASGDGEAGWGLYADILTNERYLTSLRDTVLVSLAVTVAALAVATTAALFLDRNRFFG
ncbi:MAG: ABC transporter permease, partial [Pseudomonadota bacterium]